MTDNAIRRRCLLTAVAGTVVGLAGCGGDEESTSTGTAASSTPAGDAAPTRSDLSTPTERATDASTETVAETPSSGNAEDVRGTLTISVDEITAVDDWQTHTSDEYSLFSVSVEVENTGQQEIDIFDYEPSLTVYDDTGESIVSDSPTIGIATEDKVMGPGERGTPSFSAEVPDPNAVARFDASLSCPASETENIPYCE